MSRKNLARLLLISTVLGAISLEMKWASDTENTTGALVTDVQRGTEVMPILQAMIAIALGSTLALFLLPRWAQRLTLSLTAGIGFVTSLQSIIWITGNGVGPAPSLAVISGSLITFLGTSGLFSQLSAPRGPDERAEQDKWRALDRGIDPTVDE